MVAQAAVSVCGFDELRGGPSKHHPLGPVPGARCTSADAVRGILFVLPELPLPYLP